MSKLLAFVHAETSNRAVNTASRALLSAVVAVAVAYARSQGLA
jgi:hypothetical protein